jgi:hypothetical protein
LNSQQPAEGILIHRDYGHAKLYQTVCQCFSKDCDHHISVEADDATVNVTISTEQKTNFWDKTRWHYIWTLLIKGRIQQEGTIVLSKQQALNYASVLQSAVKDVEEFQRERLNQ